MSLFRVLGYLARPDGDQPKLVRYNGGWAVDLLPIDDGISYRFRNGGYERWISQEILPWIDRRVATRLLERGLLDRDGESLVLTTKGRLEVLRLRHGAFRETSNKTGRKRKSGHVLTSLRWRKRGFNDKGHPSPMYEGGHLPASILPSDLRWNRWWKR